MGTENQQTATGVQSKPKMRRGKQSPSPISKRPSKGPTDQRKITLPGHVWELLDEVAELQSDAYALMAGKTRYSISDLLESGAEMYLRELIDELGPLPKTVEERKSYVKRLADANKKSLLADLLGTKPDTH